MGATMTKEQVCKAVWDISFHEDAGKRWDLCQSLGKLPQFEKAFHTMNKVREGHVAAAVGLGVAAAFTAGATAGLCATTTAKAAACECNFLAYCIQVGLKSGMIQAPKPSGKDMVDPKKIPDLQLWGVCQRLMQEENMAAEYALVKAQHDCFVVKIVSICISAGAGGGDLVDFGLELDGMPEFVDTLKEVKSHIGSFEDGQELHELASKSDPDLLRGFI
ncbi:unnamed protein product, partial [Polarella glacialis]